MTDKEVNEILKIYNEFRSNVTSKDLFDYLLEVPPCISSYIIKTTVATKESNIEKIRDFLIWKEYFAILANDNKAFYELKQEFYYSLYEKYNEKEEEKISRIRSRQKRIIKDIKPFQYLKQQKKIS